MGSHRVPKPRTTHKGSSSRPLILWPSNCRGIFDSLDDAVFILEAETVSICDANQKMGEMFGYTLSEVLGLTWGEVCAADNADEANRRMLSAREADSVFEWPARRKGGDFFWVEVSAKRGITKSVRLIIATIRDITVRKEAERELTATKDYLHAVFNNIHDAVLVHDAEGKVSDVNDKMLKMYGFTTRDEAIGLSIFPDYALPDNKIDQPACWRKAIAGEDQFFECKGRRPKDGHIYDAEVFLSRLPLPGGDAILAVVRDVSARKQAERELTATKDYLHAVFNNIHDAVLVHDAEGKVSDVNDKMLKMYGFTTRDEAIGLSIFPDYALPDNKIDQPACWRKAIAGEDQFFECKGRRPKDGHIYDAEVFLSRLPLPGGDAILAVVRDVSARKQAEEGLRAQTLKFQALSESSPVGMAVIDGGSSFRFKYMNPMFRELFGGNTTEFPDLSAWLAKICPDPTLRKKAEPRWVQMLTAAGSTEASVDRPHAKKVTRRNGSPGYVEFVPVQLPSDEILLACWDITKNKEAERRIRERNLVLAVLNDIVVSVGHSLEMTKILEPLSRVLFTKLRISTGAIILPGDSGQGTKTEIAWGVPETLREDFAALALQCYNEGQMRQGDDIVLSRYIPEDDGSGPGARLKRSGFRSCLSISLQAKDEVQGLVFLADRKRDTFSDDQISFYRTLGQQVSLAMENARLFGEVRRSHAEMKALSVRLVQAQEDELRYLARELHDEIGQVVTGLRLAIDMALKSTAEPVASLVEARSLADTLKGLVRELSRKLRPPMPRRPGALSHAALDV